MSDIDYPQQIRQLIKSGVAVYQGVHYSDDENVELLLGHLQYQMLCAGVDKEYCDRNIFRFLWSAMTRDEVYEIDEAFRSSSSSMLPAQNDPISDAQETPMAEPPKTESPPPAEDVLKCPLCDFTTTKLRGYKTHLKRTHQLDWATACKTYHLDEKTGQPALDSAERPAPPPGSDFPTETPPQGPGAPPLMEQQTMQFPQPPQPPQAPQPPAMPQPPQPPQAPPQPQSWQQQMGRSEAVAADWVNNPPLGYGIASPPQAPQPQQAPQGMSRLDIANQLGGPLAIALVKLSQIESAMPHLGGYTDAGQLAALAEREGLKQLGIDYTHEAPKYRQAENTIAAKFGQVLPDKVYVLLNGFDWVLDKHLIPALCARMTNLITFEGGMPKEVNLA